MISHVIFIRGKLSNFLLHPLPEIGKIRVSAGQNNVPVKPRPCIRLAFRDGVDNSLGEAALKYCLNNWLKLLWAL